MTKSGNELFRYCSSNARGLVSVRDDGTTWVKSPWNKDWKLESQKGPEVDMGDWLTIKIRLKSNLKDWQLRSRYLPSFEKIATWLSTNYSRTPTGAVVKHDEKDEHGAPSWLTILGMDP